MFSKIRPFLFKLDPELAHSLAIKALKLNYYSSKKIKKDKSIETKIFGKSISNPIGIAAGFDKDAEVYNSLFKLGFSWGGYESLILPVFPKDERKVAKWNQKGVLLRVHIGLENVDDLIEDLFLTFKL